MMRFAGALLGLTVTLSLPLVGFAQGLPEKVGQKADLVANLGDYQATGVAVSKTGRIFLSFPHWAGKYQYAVMELNKPGDTLTSYPNKGWNAWKPGDNPQKHFICVQSVYVQGNTLWVLDPASPKMAGVVPHGAKLVAINLSNNRVERVIPFSNEIAPKNSYLNDVRIDPATQTAYLSDSGLGGLVVLDLKTGKARRVLKDDPSTHSQPGFDLSVKGQSLQRDGKPAQIQADGIALDTNTHSLYYHALTSDTLYRIPTADLNNAKLSDADLAKKVETVSTIGATDGLMETAHGDVVISDLANNRIETLNPKTKQLDVLSEDPNISWPDSFAIGPDHSLYVTNSQLQFSPMMNNGVDKRTSPYKLLRFRI